MKTKKVPFLSFKLGKSMNLQNIQVVCTKGKSGIQQSQHLKLENGQRGFSLIEIMISLIIISILTSFAIPMYTQHITKSRRTDAKIALMDLAARMERFYAENHTYANATIGTNPTTDVLSMNLSSQGFYQLSILNQTATTYTLQASPIPGSSQAQNDTACGNLRLNQLGQRQITGTGDATECWR